MTNEVKELVKMGFIIIPLCSGDHKGMTPSHIKGCQSPGKRPLISKWTDITSITIEQFEKWNKQFPTANWGLVLGQTDSYNLLGIDIDGETGNNYWEEFIKDKFVPNTVEFSTGSGRRLLFYLPYGLKTKKQKITLEGNHSEVAFCCQGQQTVIPPSTHATGKKYKWLPGRSPFEIDIAQAPQWMIDLVRLNTDTINLTTINDKVTKEEFEAPINEGNRNNQLTRLVGSIIAKNDIPVEVVLETAKSINKIKINPPLGDDEVKRIVQSVYKMETEKKEIRGKYCDDKGKPIPFSLVQYILQNKYIVTIHGSTFLYDEEQNYYELLTDNQVERIYFNHCTNDSHKTTRNSTEFLKILKNYSGFIPHEGVEKRYINLENGIYDLELEQLQPHNPGLKLINQFNGSYIEDIEEFNNRFNTSKFKRFLDTTFIKNKDVIPVLQEMIGCVLSPHAKELKKAFILKGSGDNGKSIITGVVDGLFKNKDVVSGVNFKQFGDKHATYMLVNSMLNLVDDDDTVHARYLNGFKSVVSGELISVNGKYKDIINIRPNMTFITGTNNDMTFDDISSGFMNRFIIIEFLEVFGTEEEIESGKATALKDSDLKEDIKKYEMDLVITWGIEGLKRLKHNRWILSKSKTITDAKELFEEENNNIYAFIKDRLIITKNNRDTIPTDTLRYEYHNFCNEIESEPLTDKKRGAEFRKRGLKPGKVRGKRVWFGAKLK